MARDDDDLRAHDLATLAHSHAATTKRALTLVARSIIANSSARRRETLIPSWNSWSDSHRTPPSNSFITDDAPPILSTPNLANGEERSIWSSARRIPRHSRPGFFGRVRHECGIYHRVYWAERAALSSVGQRGIALINQLIAAMSEWTGTPIERNKEVTIGRQKTFGGVSKTAFFNSRLTSEYEFVQIIGLNGFRSGRWVGEKTRRL
jgi:hypothetical protein